MTANINGLAAVLARIPDMEPAAERLKHDFATALHYWPFLFVGSSVMSASSSSRFIGWWALSRVMARLLVIPDVHKLDSSTDAGPIAPVPVRLHRRPIPLPEGRPRRPRPGVAERANPASTSL